MGVNVHCFRADGRNSREGKDEGATSEASEEAMKESSVQTSDDGEREKSER